MKIGKEWQRRNALVVAVRRALYGSTTPRVESTLLTYILAIEPPYPSGSSNCSEPREVSSALESVMRSDFWCRTKICRDTDTLKNELDDETVSNQPNLVLLVTPDNDSQKKLLTELTDEYPNIKIASFVYKRKNIGTRDAEVAPNIAKKIIYKVAKALTEAGIITT